MYNAKRDGKAGAASNAIPSIGVIEGRITVLEVLAATCLKLLLNEGDKLRGKQVLSAVRKAMRSKCKDIHLNPDDAASALAYIQELLDATFESAEFEAAKSVEDSMLIA